MQAPHDHDGQWRRRAGENLRAAILLAARQPPLLHPAVSRIYYASFQATCAALVAKGLRIGRRHADVWRAANHVRLGLGAKLHRLYSWRLAADYASQPLPAEVAQVIVARCAQLTRELGISEAP